MKLVTANSKLRADIRTVQSQLKSAIQNHQMILFKLKDRPVSIKLRVQMTNVQRHIISLGEKQKKLLIELRQEMESNGEIKKTEPKPSLKALENLRPNPVNPVASSQPINRNNEPAIKMECPENYESTPDPVKPAAVSHSSRRKSKLVAISDELPKNGHGSTPSSSPSQKENTPSSTPCSSPTHVVDLNKQTSQRTAKCESFPTSSASEESQDAYIQLPADPEQRKKLQFMTALSLVTREVLTELQNRRTERKRRSTTNPHFHYGNPFDLKRKKPLYLTNSSSGAVLTGDTLKDVKDQDAPTDSIVCFSCSAANGTLCQCSVCHKSFHWNCVYDADFPLPSGEAMRCEACQQGSSTKTQIEEEK